MKKSTTTIANGLMIALCIFFLTACDTFQIESETSVDAFREYCNTEVRPHFDEGESGSFTGVDGIEIAFKVFPVEHAKGALVILHGKSENLTKYAELVYDLKDFGYAIYLMDHRGHGASGRMLDDPMKVYVEDFDDYVTDANTFVEEIVKRRDGNEKLILLGHSMGGGIATLYLEAHPDTFTGAVLSSPMQSINTADVLPMTENTAHFMASTKVKLGQGESYGTGQKAPEGFGMDTTYDEGQARFFEEHVTHSYKRWLTNEEYLSENPELLAGGAIIGVTWNWLDESYTAIKKARSNAWKIHTPVLLFEAGDDHFVTDKGHQKFVSNLQPGILRDYVRFDESICPDHASYHEILCEVDEIRDNAIGRIKTFVRSFE